MRDALLHALHSHLGELPVPLLLEQSEGGCVGRFDLGSHDRVGGGSISGLDQVQHLDAQLVELLKRVRQLGADFATRHIQLVHAAPHQLQRFASLFGRGSELLIDVHCQLTLD